MRKKSKYSRNLRAIGQDLEAKGVIAFDLFRNGNDYLVQAKAGFGSKKMISPHSPGPPRSEHSLPQKPLAEPSSSGTFRFYYTPDKIEDLDVKGRARRGSLSGPPDFLSLSQVLRVVGASIDLRDGQLLSVSRPVQLGRIQSVTIQYENYQGELKQEERTYPNIYDLSVHLYKQRHTWCSPTLRAFESR